MHLWRGGAGGGATTCMYGSRACRGDVVTGDRSSGICTRGMAAGGRLLVGSRQANDKDADGSKERKRKQEREKGIMV